MREDKLEPRAARDGIDRQHLIALITRTRLNFPPPGDANNARSFRLIGVDYLEGALTYEQFNRMYGNDKTAEQITDEIIGARGSWIASNLKKAAPIDKWAKLRLRNRLK
jgi:hypothetical protein